RPKRVDVDRVRGVDAEKPAAVGVAGEHDRLKALRRTGGERWPCAPRAGSLPWRQASSTTRSRASRAPAPPGACRRDACTGRQSDPIDPDVIEDPKAALAAVQDGGAKNARHSKRIAGCEHFESGPHLGRDLHRADKRAEPKVAHAPIGADALEHQAGTMSL